MSDLHCLEIFANQMEAELARSRLESAGLKAYIFADNEGGLLPGLSLSGGGFRLMIEEDQFGAARRILAEVEAEKESEP